MVSAVVKHGNVAFGTAKSVLFIVSEVINMAFGTAKSVLFIKVF